MARIKKTILTDLNNKIYYAPMLIPSISKSADDIYIKVTHGTRLDVIAEKIYNDSSLWWLIAHMNNLDLHNYSVSDELVLRLVNPIKISQVLSKIQNAQQD